MKKPEKNELWQASSFVLCATVAWAQTDEIGGSEFIGGRVTGPIFALFESGILVFGLAVLVTFIYRRVGAIMGIAASLLCFPLYLYCTVRRQVRSVSPSEESIRFRSNPTLSGTIGRLGEC
jgi:hypothetical protein